VAVSFTPSILGKVFGLKPFEMSRPLSCTLDHGEVAEIAELRERDFSALIKRNADCFSNAGELISSLQTAERRGRYQAELRCRPQDDEGDRLVERWLLPQGAFEHQTIFTVRRGTADRYPSFRIIGMSPAGVEIIDAPTILGTTPQTGSVGRWISWWDLSTTRETPPDFTPGVVSSLDIGGVTRRIELAPTGIEFSPGTYERLESFIEGVASAERSALVPPGQLVVRIAPLEFDYRTRHGGIVVPPLGTVTWSPNTEFVTNTVGNDRDGIREQHRRAGMWAGRNAIALAIAHTPGAEALDRILTNPAKDVRTELEQLLFTARDLGAPVPFALTQRTDLVLLALAIAESPALAQPMSGLTGPTKQIICTITQVVDGLRDGTL